VPDARRADAERLVAVERHWPGSRQFLLARGVRSLKWITEVFPIARLWAGLSVRPRHDFGEWLEELAARPEETPKAIRPGPDTADQGA
jgi:hypothetical protein